MSHATVQRVERIGQVTGSVGPGFPETRDPEGRPLVTETGRWGVRGVDLGANTEHRGRLFVFFGDSFDAPHGDPVCWTDDRQPATHGGHVATELDFVLPNDRQGAAVSDGEADWRFCVACHGLCRPDTTSEGVCPAGGAHHPAGWNFVLPHEGLGGLVVDGQRGWRRCERCRALFWNGDGDDGTCPAGGAHLPDDRRYVLSNVEHGATPATGQSDWRFCPGCHGLAWNGMARKGCCPGSAGGAIALDTVVGADGRFVPLAVEGPIGLLGFNETPTGAFSSGDRVYVFVWVGQRPDGVAAGSYLLSTPDPTSPAPFRFERAISPLRFDSCAYWQVAPVVVDNSVHPGLPASSGQGLVMVGHGFDASLGADGVHVAWMPLGDEHDPATAPIHYAAPAAGGGLSWSVGERQGRSLFRQAGYTAVSLLWIGAAARWVLLYSKAGLADPAASLPDRKDEPIVARLGRSLTDWSDEIAIFDPVRDGAVGRYMHRPGTDQLHRYPPGMVRPGWAYGAFLVERFSRWQPASRLLELTYLLSTFSPYQVQLMRTTLLLDE